MQILHLYLHLPCFVVRMFHSHNVFAWSTFQIPTPIAITPFCSHRVNDCESLIHQGYLGVWDSSFCKTILHILIHRDGFHRLSINKCGNEGEDDGDEVSFHFFLGFLFQ